MAATLAGVLADVIDVLRCPVCAGGLELVESSVRCEAGHAFDVARQGYVNLLGGGAVAGTADTAAMVQARAEFLAAGHYAPLADAIGAIAADLVGHVDDAQVRDSRADRGRGLDARADGARALDAGGGTGYYLSAVLDRLPRSSGLALDVSKFAVRRAARAHPKIGAAVWDVWQPLPVADGAIDVVVNVFAPRNGAEFCRVLGPDGVLLVVTPTGEHLAELVGRTGMLTVDAQKEKRLERTVADWFRLERRDELTIPLTLGVSEVRQVVAMGPSAWHVDERLRDRDLTVIPTPVHTTASFAISIYRPT